MTKLQRLINRHPLGALLTIAAGLRIIASIFARGYMGSDDHFQVIEMAAEWIRGNNPGLPGGEMFYRSLLYPGLNWLLMWVSHQVGIVHPDGVMLVNRFAHAAFSLWTIVIAYRLALLLKADQKTAFRTGLICAAGFIMPYASVRNLIEVVSMPFLLYAVYQITNAEQSDRRMAGAWLLAGLAGGLAFIIRWQVGSAMLGIGLYLIYKQHWRGLFLIIAASLVPVLFQGWWDWSWHGIFFGSFLKNLGHNVERVHGYLVGPWYRYILLALGIFVPPFSLLFCGAMVKYARRMGVLPWAVFSFFIIHSVIPNKQERFMLPIFAGMAVLGTVGLAYWTEDGSDRFRRWVRWGWRWFWAINTPLVIVACINYSQKARIASLVYIYEQGDATGVLADYTERRTRLPEFYLDGAVTQPRPIVYAAQTVEELDTLRLRENGTLGPPIAPINYVVIFARGNLEDHLTLLRRHFGEVEIVKHVSPSIADRILNILNPKHNHSKESWVGRVWVRTPVFSGINVQRARQREPVR